MSTTQLLIAALATTTIAQAMLGQTTVYWTGNTDRWGGSPHTNWTLSPGGDDYFAVTGGSELQIHYDLSAMEGAISSVLMNRRDVVIHSMILNGQNRDGFMFDTAGDNSTNIKSAGPLTVIRGYHQFNNSGANRMGLSKSAVWSIHQGAGLTWNIPLDEEIPGTRLTKQGEGSLLIGGDFTYTGSTHILAGTFGSTEAATSLAGNLVMGNGSRLLVKPGNPLSVAGGISFDAPFGIANLESHDGSLASGSYMIIDGPVDTRNLLNASPFMAGILEDGRRAYFSTEDGLWLHLAEDYPQWPLAMLEWLGFEEGHPVLMTEGPPGVSNMLQSSIDLWNWQNLRTIQGSDYWTDPMPMNNARRFYRLVQTDPRPGLSANPAPAHGALNIGNSQLLSWDSEGESEFYDVYFGTDAPGEFIGSQQQNSFDPGPLLPNTTYYWRVNQRNGTVVTEGEVWSFSTVIRPSQVSYIGAGAPAASTGPINLELPEGLLPGDILITFLQTSGPHIYLQDTAGGRWLALARREASSQSAGEGDDEVHLTAYYSRYNGSQGAPTTNDSGDHQLGVILAFRGVVANGAPWDTVDGATRESRSTNAFIPGSTTSVPNTMVVGAIATALPALGGGENFSGWSARNSNMINLTERIDVSTLEGNGGSLGIATAEYAPVGVSYGRIDLNLSVASYQAMLSAALRPEVVPGQINEAWPHNGSGHVGITAQLRWTASSNSATREVYFGTSSPGEYQGSQTDNTFDPGILQPNTTYYWRVDEKNAAGTTTGEVYSFTTEAVAVLPQLAGMTADNAMVELAQAGASTGNVTRIFSDTVAPGVVIGQNPPAGSAIEPGMVVDLVRSRGPESGVVVFPNGPDELTGRGKLPVHRNLSLVTSKAGTLLAFTGHRPNGSPDEDSMQIHLKRSTDDGETWGPAIVVAEDGMHRCATQVALVLPAGQIMLLWLWNEWIPSQDDRGNRRVYVTHSDDDGVTWSAHREITSDVFLPGWRWYGLGPGNAFVKQRPPNAGRLIIPARHGRVGASGRPHIIYSDDGGETFHLGGTLDRGSESTAAELSDGSILFNVRLGSIDHRYAGVSSDGGLSFPVQYIDFGLPGAGACQASLLVHSFNPVTGKNNILFSNPDDLDERINGTIKLSELDGEQGTWSRKFRYSTPAPAFSGYSDITVMNEAGDIGILWEFGSHYSKPARWDGGVKFRAIRFDQINEPIP